MNGISLAERKKIRNILILRVYLFTLIVCFPFVLLQEFFFFPYMVPNPTSISNALSMIHEYFIAHHMYTTYSILMVLVTFSLIHFVYPYVRYVMKGDNAEQVTKKFINPLGMIGYYFIVPNICNLINFALDYQYIISLPRDSLIYFIIFKTVWLCLSSFLTIYYFLTISRRIRESLNIHTFEDKQLSFFPSYKSMIFLVVLFSFLLLMLLQTFALVEQGKSDVTYIVVWGLWMNVGMIFLVNILLVYQDVINSKIKKQLAYDMRKLVENGDLTQQHTYYERNFLGSFLSEYNAFTEDLRQGLSQIAHITDSLKQTQGILKTNNSELTKTLSAQEINVYQMNIAINTTSTTIQHVLTDLHNQNSELQSEQQKIEYLTSGTNNLIEIFQSIVHEHKLSQDANSKALTAVENSLVKTELMNKQIETIHQQIYTAGLETSAIDEVLGAIRNIAEQTNLLSMSAAIEAAHGDNSRKGFSLVAEEIRKLALMSQDSVSKIAIRLSSITEYIADAYSMSKDSIDLSSSSLQIGEQLKVSIAQISQTSKDLYGIIEQAEPITKEQKVLIDQFQEIITNMQQFLQNLIVDLKDNSAAVVMLSLNFRTMIQNFKQERSAIYHIESGIEQLTLIENQLQEVLDEFNFQENNSGE